MRNLLNPKWLFVINSLPILLLFFLMYGQFSIIQSLLEESNIQLWKSFGLSLGILVFLNFVYAVFLVWINKKVSFWYGIISLITYISFIYIYFFYLDELIPSSVPQWMLSGNIFLYVGTFLMPTLAYALLILVLHFTAEDKKHNPWLSFLIAITIPSSIYLFSQIILPLWQDFDDRLSEHTILVLFITCAVGFLFFLIRGIYILVSKKSELWQKYQLVWKIPIAIVFPLLGLGINNGHLFDYEAKIGWAIFGDFSNIWFYILAFANGVFVCLPNLDKILYRILLFALRSITFAYTFYFFIVFLPFLPLSVVAIIAIGTGFLMLVPLMLFVIHINELYNDFAYLKVKFSKKLIVSILFLGFLVIPMLITFTYYTQDKSILNETLAYVYSPDYSKKYDIDKNSLETTLNIIKIHKANNRGGIFGTQIPYLSSYFNWLVMDNLTLSDAKIDTIEKIFFGKDTPNSRFQGIQKDNVGISKATSQSQYDKEKKFWRSWINLEITNESQNNRFAEYVTTINLPEGTWISDYYLYVGDRKEYGILAEKKAAMWIFSQIRNENKDPGLLYYLTGNKVAFRVFPFAKEEVRKTGIELLHKEPIVLSIDNYNIELGNLQESVQENIETENIAYVSAQKKQKLKTIKRKPYFHFLVDISNENKVNTEKFIKRIEKVLKSYEEISSNAKISFVNSYVETISLDENWKNIYRNKTFEGGFYLDRAIRSTLVKAFQNQTDSYPLLISVTDSIENAVLDKDFSDLKFAFPESELFYNLDKNGILKEHSLVINPIEALPETLRECMFCETVLAYKSEDNPLVYIPNNNEPSIVLKKEIFEVSDTEIQEKDWLTALYLQGKWRLQILHPETADKEWLDLVKYSFKSRVMTPLTSYLVVENEAQKAMLKKKQKQALSGNKSLDLGEETQRMSEPSFVLLFISIGLFLWYRKRFKSKTV